MQDIQIAGRKFTTIASMKQFALEHGMDTKGSSKWVKSQWVEAVESCLKAQSEVVAVAIEVQQAIVLTESESVAPALTAAVTIEDAAVAAFQALTSPKACQFYRAVLQGACLAVVFMTLLGGKMARWCWESRDRTAVYCWVKDAIESGMFNGLILMYAVCQFVVLASVLPAIAAFDAYICDGVVSVQSVADRALVRLGLGGCAIKVR
jgi:hypothetical protein